MWKYFQNLACCAASYSSHTFVYLLIQFLHLWTQTSKIAVMNFLVLSTPSDVVSFYASLIDTIFFHLNKEKLAWYYMFSFIFFKALQYLTICGRGIHDAVMRNDSCKVYSLYSCFYLYCLGSQSPNYLKSWCL